MATNQCRACGHTVHYSAKACPSCGAQAPHQGQFVGLMVMLGICVIIIGFAISQLA